LDGIGPFNKFEWGIVEEDDILGWHVFLGGNGSGKTSIIKSIALSLIGPNDAQYLHQTWHRLVNSKKSGYIISTLQCHDIDKDINGNTSNINDQLIGIIIESLNGKPYKPLSMFDISGYVSKNSSNINRYVEKTIWSNASGWFSASFGPYRRFSGGDPKYLDAYLQNPKAAPHISAFGEDAALGGALQWLKDQARPSRQPDGAKITDLVTRVINSDKFLPNNVRLHEINEDEILFKDGAGSIIDIEQLGDGYRSALCITIELIHQLVLSFGVNALTESPHLDEIIIPGVVLIDEVDAHLHPIWQQQIGFWLTKRFPQMQFIVTTHSPLICQAAKTVYKLPTPGSGEEGHFIEGLELDRLRYGNIYEAYASEAFGKIERSEEGKKKLERLVKLERLSWERELTEEECKEQQELQSIFIATPVGLSPLGTE
jgi:hypothetical protein